MNQPKPTDPFAQLIDCLMADGLNDEANRLKLHRYQTACTTGTELLGLLGREMRTMRREIRTRGSVETKNAFMEAKQIVKKAWPTMFWF